MGSSRLECNVCLRAQTACICRWVRPVPTGVEVLILQHPMEVGHAKNTGRLLHLCLPSSRLVVGEVFDGTMLAPKTTLLLYPSETSQGHLPAAALPDVAACKPDALRLVVLDATWRKSRKMLHMSPWLQQMPRFALDGPQASRYTIRKAHRPGQLSTLEATCLALMQLEPDAGLLEPVLQGFEGFVAQQQGYQNRH